MSKGSDNIRPGDTVTVGNGKTLWRVVDFRLRPGPVLWARVTPLGGGSVMTAKVEDLHR